MIGFIIFGYYLVNLLDPCSRPANPLIEVAGFRPEFIRTCGMHTIHLGVLQLLNGSIFTLLDEIGCWVWRELSIMWFRINFIGV